MMKKTIAILAFALLASAAASAERTGPARSASLDNLRIKGVMMYDNDKSVENIGLYSYTVTSPVARRILLPMPRIYVNGGSVAVGGKLYTYSYDIKYGYVNSAKYYVYDLTSGEQLGSTSMGYDLATAYSHAAMSSAVDPVSGTVYSSGYEYNETDKTLSVKLKTWNLAENTKTVVGDMIAPLIVMAFDKEGRLWGITASSSETSVDGGFLVKVDKATGAQTVVGDTGVRPYYDQSAVIDPSSGTFYWLANTQSEESYLYTVDLENGNATAIGALPNGDEVVAATINPNEYSDASPSPVSNLTLTPSAPYNVELAFDMPATSYDGTPLTGTCTWVATIKGNSTVTREGTAEAGAHVTETLELDASQQADVTVTVARDGVFGPEAQAPVYIGYEKMNAVADLTLKYTDNTNTLTWTAPTTGHFNGLQSAEGFRYIIKRMPEGVSVAEAHNGTTFAEAVTDDNLRSTYYTVATVNGDVTGDEAQSNAVITGSAITPPYSQDFDLSNAFDLFTVVDANKDNNTWYYSVKSAKYRQSTSNSADDYLFMPAFNLKAGNSYELSFDGYGTNTRYTNLLDVVLASAPDAELAEAITAEPVSFANDSRSVINHKVTVTPAADGKYYIGFHLVSTKSQGTFTIDNVTLSEGKSTSVPASASEFTATPGERGALTASLTVTAPTVSAAGMPLGAEEQLSLKVTRGDAEVYSCTMLPGATEKFDDENIDNAGKYSYTACFANAVGEGEIAVAEVFVGIDTPVAPAEVTLSDNNDGTGIVTWSPSAEGTNGGYVDVDNVIYTVSGPDGILNPGVKGTSAQISVPAEGAQAKFSVKVAAAYTGNATAPSTASNEILSGMPYSLPYAESFAGAAPSTSPWEKQVVSGKSSDTSWAARADQTQDNDGGAADMTAYSAASSRWAGPKIDISTAALPELSAYVYLPDGNTRLTLQLQKDNGEWTDLTSVDSAPDGWVLMTASLTDYKSKNVRLGLLGECFGGMHFVYVDNITIKDKTSGVEDVATAAVAEISAHDGAIVIMSELELPIAVYTVDGRCIANLTAKYAEIPVESGAYIVKAGSRTVKIML